MRCMNRAVADPHGYVSRLYRIYINVVSTVYRRRPMIYGKVGDILRDFRSGRLKYITSWLSITCVW